MADVTLSKTLSPVMFQQNRVINFSRMAMLMAPQFAPDQLDALHRDAGAVVHSLDQKTWISLIGWLDAASTASVQCRRSGLTIQIPRKSNTSAALLQPDGNSPTATLIYNDSGGEAKARPLQTVTDTEAGFLKMQLAFDGNLYDEVFTAMSTPNAGAAVRIDYAHSLQIRTAAPPPPPPPPPPPHRFGGGGIVFRPQQLQRATMSASPARFASVSMPATAAPLMMAHPAVSESIMDREVAQRSMMMMNPGILARRDVGRIFIPVQHPPAGDTIQDQKFAGQILISLAHSQSDQNVFPDLIQQSKNGWDQVPQYPEVHFRYSDKIDTYYYLPTQFKVGFYFESGAGSAGALPPLSVELYPGDDGRERIKATLIALPCIDDAQRLALRNHLQVSILKKLQPFVYLEPRSGTQAEFLTESLASGTAAQPRGLPVQIVCKAVEVVPDDRIQLLFDMPAEQYPVFCELLKFGIVGRVKLFETGLEAQVPVRLQLEDLTVNRLRIEQTAAAAPAQPGAPGAAATLSVANPLDYPVQVPSLTLNLLDRGDASGMILDAESQQLLSAVRSLAPQPGPESTASFPVQPQRVAGWDTSVIEPGQLKVLAGTAEEWLTRVNRGSMKGHEFKLKLQLITPPLIQNRVQLIRLRLFKDGDANSRTQQDLLPGTDGLFLRVAMTLEELAGDGGKAVTFSAEYETLGTDGTLSPAQRVPVSSDTGTLVLRALAPTANTVFTIESEGEGGTTRQDMARAALDAAIAQLRASGKHWEVFSREPEPDTHTDTTAGNQATTTTQPASGPQVTIVTDLAAIALQNGALTRVFVVLKADQDAAPQSSFSFDAANHNQTTWQPAGVSIPPFRYQITYLYPDNKVQNLAGTSSNLTLFLDPPPPG